HFPHDQGHRHRHGDRRTGTHAQRGYDRHPELPAHRSVHGGPGHLFHSHLPRYARSGHVLPARGASGPTMNLDWSLVTSHWQLLAHGVLLTVMLTFCTMLIAVPGGSLLASMRLSRFRVLSAGSACFVEFSRNVPIILVVYWAFYVMPVLSGLSLSPFMTGLVALALNNSAYNSETFRGWINLVRRMR